MRDRLAPLLAALSRFSTAIRRAASNLPWRRRSAAPSRSEAAARPRAPGPARRAPVQREVAGDSYASVVAEADDDIASVTGRIDTAADTNVVLFVPKAARAMRDPTIWPHVAAHARRRGIALAVVSGRRDVRGHAEANGLTTARSIARLRRGRRRVRAGAREFTLPRMPWRGLANTAAVIAFVIAVASVACYAVPSAEIVIAPPSTEFSTTLRARLSPLASMSDIGNGVLPARNLRVITTATLSVEATGEAEIPDEPATVVVEFTNDGEEGLTVPAGTLLLDDNGIAFATDEELTVPAGRSERVDATAVEPGPLGNIDAEALRHLDGFPATLTATNPRAARGGTTRTVPGIGEDDLARVRQIAEGALDRVAERALAREVDDGRVFSQTRNVAILSETALAKIGDPADYLLVEYQVVATALALTTADLAAYAPEIVRAGLAPGVALLPGTATAVADAPAELDGGNVILIVEARGRVTQLFDPELVGDAVIGARPATAAARLTEMLDLVEPPRITIRPGIIPWRWLPRRANQISFVLTAPGAGDGSVSDGAGTPAVTPTPTATPTAAPATTPTTARIRGTAIDAVH